MGFKLGGSGKDRESEAKGEGETKPKGQWLWFKSSSSKGSTGGRRRRLSVAPTTADSPLSSEVPALGAHAEQPRSHQAPITLPLSQASLSAGRSTSDGVEGAAQRLRSSNRLPHRSTPSDTHTASAGILQTTVVEPWGVELLREARSRELSSGGREGRQPAIVPTGAPGERPHTSPSTSEWERRESEVGFSLQPPPSAGAAQQAAVAASAAASVPGGDSRGERREDVFRGNNSAAGSDASSPARDGTQASRRASTTPCHPAEEGPSRIARLFFSGTSQAAMRLHGAPVMPPAASRRRASRVEVDLDSAASQSESEAQPAYDSASDAASAWVPPARQRSGHSMHSVPSLSPRHTPSPRRGKRVSEKSPMGLQPSNSTGYGRLGIKTPAVPCGLSPLQLRGLSQGDALEGSGEFSGLTPPKLQPPAVQPHAEKQILETLDRDPLRGSGEGLPLGTAQAEGVEGVGPKGAAQQVSARPQRSNSHNAEEEASQAESSSPITALLPSSAGRASKPQQPPGGASSALSAAVQAREQELFPSDSPQREPRRGRESGEGGNLPGQRVEAMETRYLSPQSTPPFLSPQSTPERPPRGESSPSRLPPGAADRDPLGTKGFDGLPEALLQRESLVSGTSRSSSGVFGEGRGEALSTEGTGGTDSPKGASTPEAQERRRRGRSGPPPSRTGMEGTWRRVESEEHAVGRQQVEELLCIPRLQRLAYARTTEMEITETDSRLEVVRLVALTGTTLIREVQSLRKDGGVVEGPRPDARMGKLRSQLTITGEGHVHIRSLQSQPHAAVLHERLKLSSNGNRLRCEQKVHLLASQPDSNSARSQSLWQRIL